jgi:hypothetical protein
VLVEKPNKKSSFYLKIEDITADFEWDFQPEGSSIIGKSEYKAMLRNNFKFDPVLHGFGNKENTKSNN